MIDGLVERGQVAFLESDVHRESAACSDTRRRFIGENETQNECCDSLRK